MKDHLKIVDDMVRRCKERIDRRDKEIEGLKAQIAKHKNDENLGVFVEKMKPVIDEVLYGEQEEKIKRQALKDS